MKTLISIALASALTTGCTSGPMSASDCLALDSIRALLITRSKAEGEKAVSIESPIRQARNEHCFYWIKKSEMDKWDECVVKAIDQSSVQTDNDELRRLTGKDYIKDIVITSDTAQLHIEKSRSLLMEAQNTTQQMIAGQCALQ